VRFGRSPIEIDEYFYDDDADNDDRVEQSSDFISRRSPRRHYVRFGRDSGGNGRHYVRFGRNAGATADKRVNRHYVRFGRDQPHQQNKGAEKRAHYVRFGRGAELGLHGMADGSDNDRLHTADKRPNYVRFG